MYSRKLGGAVLSGYEWHPGSWDLVRACFHHALNFSMAIDERQILNQDSNGPGLPQ